MYQEINLYRPTEITTERFNYLSWRRFWLYNFLFIIALTIYYLIILWQLDHLNREKNLLAVNNTALQQNFNELKLSFPSAFFSGDINASVKQIEQQLIFQEKLIASLQNTVPFSQNLISLADLNAQNVWLTNIIISKSGREIILKGKSIGSQSFNQFITKLMMDRTFMQFGLMVDNIANPSKTSVNNILDFEISLKKRN